MAKETGNRTSEQPWSAPVSIQEVPDTGFRLELQADERIRAAVARAADILAVLRLEAVFDLTRQSGERLLVTGRVSATVRQACIVTLDPVDNEVEEAVEVMFDPAAVPDQDAGRSAQQARSHARGAAKPGGGRSAKIEVTADEAPEPLVGDTVDLGALATEFLMLGLDPYPRKPGAAFENPSVEDASDHPFAALAKLRNGNDR